MYVVLTDIYVKGHHLTFIQQYALCLLRQNKKLVLLFPEPQLITDYLSQFSDINQQDIITETIQESTLKLKLPPFFFYFVLVLKRWLNLASCIRNITRKHNIKIDFVFIMWLDSYLYKYFPKSLHAAILRYQWSGIYFHPNHIRKSKYKTHKQANFFTIDNLLRAKNCKAVGVLDFFIADKLSYRISKPVISFPDITNVAFEPNFENNVTKAIELKKANRTVVGFIGIEPRKNIINLILCINKYKLDDFLFVMIGELNTSVFNAIDVAILNHFIQNLPPNCIFINQYVKDGIEYNAIFNRFDIAWACYLNFYTASNILVKASYFKKPVLGSTGNYIEDAVKKYQLGLCANPDDLEMIYQTLMQLKQNMHLYPYRFELFFEKHNMQSLYNSFEKLEKIS